MKKKLTIHHMTLLETICACALLVLLMTSIIFFFLKTTKLNKNITQSAFANQQILLLKQNWRNFIHNTPSANFAIKDNNTKITSGSYSATFKDRSIIFITKNNKTSSLKLSKRIRITFSEEHVENQHLLIMNIHLQSSSFSKTNEETIRIVTCLEAIKNSNKYIQTQSNTLFFSE